MGLVAAVAGLGVAELVAGVLLTTRSPVVAVADLVIRRGPGPWERAVIARLGTADKPVLVLVVLAATLGLGVVAGRSSWRVAVAIVTGVAAVGIAGALTEQDSSWVHALAPLAGGLASLGVLRWGVAADPVTDAPLAQAGMSRRLLLVGSAAVAGGGLGRVLQRRVDAEASRRAVVLPRPAKPLPPVPAATSVGVDGVTPWTTPNGDFYRIDTALVMPQVETAGWELVVHGMVDRRLRLTYDDLLSRPLVEADVTVACVSNEVGGHLIGNARWLGVPLRSLLEEAGVSPRADQLVGRAVDGFTTGAPLQAILDGRDALVAVGMNGEPLPVRHGFPARLVVAGLYGYVSATKWLSSIEVTRFDKYSAYWIERGWSPFGPVKVQSRIDTPRRSARAGTVPVAGVAWAQGRGVDRVEVRVDDRPWEDAQLGAGLGNDTWRQWRYDWDATPGKHQLAVRATTEDGEGQPYLRAGPFPSGATGWHTVSVRVT